MVLFTMKEKSVSKPVVLMLGAIVFVLAIAIMYLLKSIFIPLVIAVILSFVGQPIIKLLKKIKIPTAPAILIYILILVFVIVLVLGFFTNNITQFVKNSEKYKKDYVGLIDKYSEQLEEKLDALKKQLRIPDDTDFSLFELMEDSINSIQLAAESSILSEKNKSANPEAGVTEEGVTHTNSVQSLLQDKGSSELLTEVETSGSSFLESFDWFALLKPMLSFSGSIVNFMGKLMLIMIFLMFLLAESSSFRSKLLHSFPGEKGLQIRTIVQNINEQVVVYLNIKVLVSLITGILVFISAKIIGLDYAFMWGVIAFVMNFIPSIGSIIFFFMPSFMAVVQFLPQERWGSMIAVFIAVGMIEFLVGNIIDPKISGDKLDLSPLVIIVSLLFWGWLWGIAGMFLAVPMMLVIKLVCENVPAMHPVAVMLGSGKQFSSRKKKGLAGLLDRLGRFILDAVKNIIQQLKNRMSKGTVKRKDPQGAKMQPVKKTGKQQQAVKKVQNKKTSSTGEKVVNKGENNEQ